jgi:CHAD domain-containing protein
MDRDGDPRSLHRARVASRRLRELVPVLPLTPGTARKLNRRLRKITARLGAVRELDVLLLLIDELRESRRRHSDALARVAVAVARDRDRSRGRRPKRVPVDDLRRMARKLGDLADDLEGASPRAAKATRWAVEARVARRAERLAEALRDASAVYLPERLHDVRIAVKKLRYSIELGRSVGTRTDPAALRALKRVQDALGRMRDMQVLIDRVRQVQATLTPPNVAVWRSLDALVASLDDDCRRLHARFMRLRPELDKIGERESPKPGTRHSAPGARRVG